MLGTIEINLKFPSISESAEIPSPLKVYKIGFKKKMKKFNFFLLLLLLLQILMELQKPGHI